MRPQPDIVVGKATRLLIREIDRGGAATPVVTRLVESLGSVGHLLRAIGFARLGQFAAARSDIAAALQAPRTSTVARWVSGIVLYVTRDYGRAFDELRAALGQRMHTRDVLERALLCAGRLGWDQEMRQLIHAALNSEPESLRWHDAALERCLRARDYAGALPHAQAAARLNGECAARHLVLGDIYARARDSAAAEHAAQAASELARGSDERLAVARLLLDLGCFARARSVLAELISESAEPRAYAMLGWLDLWHGDSAAAQLNAGAALAREAACGAALTLQAALHLRGDDAEAALSILDRVLVAQGDEHDALLWRAEAHLRRGNFDAARRDIMRARLTTHEYSLCSWLLWALAALHEADGETLIGLGYFEECADAMRELCPAADLGQRQRPARLLIALFEEALSRIEGNRSTNSTYLHNGVLRRLNVRSAPRHAARRALELIRYLPVNAVFTELDNVVRQYPESSLPLCHRGELHVWLGNIDRARADLQAAIALNRATRWAYIGLTALDILEGEYERALQTSAAGVAAMGDTEGPAVYVYRGEALRRLGRIEEALVDLQRACDLNPTRVGAWVNLGLALAAGRDSAGLRAIFGRLQRSAAGLLSDAARELGVTLWGDGDFDASDETKVQVLEQALHMLRGNRSSSCVTYFTAAGHLRRVPQSSTGGDLHACDQQDLDAALKILTHALSL